MMIKKILYLIPEKEERNSVNELPKNLDDLVLEYEIVEAKRGELEKTGTNLNVYDLVLIKLTRRNLQTRELSKLCQLFSEKVKILGIGEFESISFYRTLKSIGFNDYISEPIDFKNFREVMLSSFGMLDISQQTFTSSGRKIAVIGSKGGIGVSTLVANLGALLAREYGQTVSLVEMFSIKRDLSYFFGKALGRGVYDFNVDNKLPSSLERLGIKIEDKIALYSMISPLAPQLSENTLYCLRALIGLISNTSQVTFIELSHFEQGALIDLFSNIVDDVIILIDGSVSSIAHTNTITSMISNQNRKKIKVVHTMKDLWSDGYLQKEIIEENLKTLPCTYVPFDQKSGLKALNSGVLLSELSKKFEKSLFTVLSELGYQKPPSQNFFKALLNMK